MSLAFLRVKRWRVFEKKSSFNTSFSKKNDLQQVEINSFKKRAWWGEMGIDRKWRPRQ
jgi:hypothetical protein